MKKFNPLKINMETQTQTFKPVFLWKDQPRIDAILNEMQLGVNLLNEFLNLAESTLGKKLNDFQKNLLQTQGAEQVRHLFISSFKFPLASFEFNMESVGKLKEFNNLSNVWDKTSPKFKYTSYKLKDGVFVIDENELQKLEEENSVYTKNERQNEILNLCEEIVVLLHKAEALNIVDQYGRQQMQRVIAPISVELCPEAKQFKLMVNRPYLGANYLN